MLRFRIFLLPVLPRNAVFLLSSRFGARIGISWEILTKLLEKLMRGASEPTAAPAVVDPRVLQAKQAIQASIDDDTRLISGTSEAQH